MHFLDAESGFRSKPAQPEWWHASWKSEIDLTRELWGSYSHAFQHRRPSLSESSAAAAPDGQVHRDIFGANNKNQIEHRNTWDGWHIAHPTAVEGEETGVARTRSCVGRTSCPPRHIRRH